MIRLILMLLVIYLVIVNTVRPFSAFLPAVPCMATFAPKCKVRSDGATNKSSRSQGTHQGAKRIMIRILPLKNAKTAL